MSINRHQAVGAYRRWEPPTFDQHGELVPPAPPPAPEEDGDLDTAGDSDGALPAGFRLPTAEEIEQMQEAARAEARGEGHAEGFAEGRAAGLEEGRAAGRAEGLEEGRKNGYAEGRKKAQGEADRFSAMIRQLDEAFTRLDEEVAEELMALALALAHKMVRNTLADRPEAVLDTLRAALHELPHTQARIRLHPDDAALAREYLGEQLAHGEHRLIDDDTLSRGGCVVEANGTQIDASLETRWRRTIESLGRQQPGWRQALDAIPEPETEPADNPAFQASTELQVELLPEGHTPAEPVEARDTPPPDAPQPPA